MIKIFLTTFFCINIFASELELSGTVISDNEKIISSRNMGLIKEVYVSEGTTVKKAKKKVTKKQTKKRKNVYFLKYKTEKDAFF